MEDQQIMCFVLLKVKTLNHLSLPDLRSLQSLFNLQLKGSFEEGLIELKKTISYIVLIERHDLMQYLSLSKFRRISMNLYTQLFTYFKQLWDLFQMERAAIDKESLKSFQQVKSPMEKIQKSFENKDIKHKQNNTEINYGRYPSFYPPFNPTNQDNRLGFPGQSIPSYIFPYQNYMGGQLFQNFNNRGNLFNNLVIQNRNAPTPFPDNNLKINEPLEPRKQIEPSSDIEHFKQEEFSAKETPFQDDAIRQLKGCFCGQAPDSTLIKCRFCNKQFHFKCWQAQTQVDATCPFCRITKQHCYTKLIGKPIFQRCSLTDPQFYNTRKIALNEQELSSLNDSIRHVQASSERAWIELRILKVSKEQQQVPKGMKSCFNMSMAELRKIQERKYMELKFKNICIGDCLIFILVCVTAKQLEELQHEVETQNKKQSNNFVKEWLNARGLKNYKLNLVHPITKNRIFQPVRGPRCEHIECEDLSVIYEQGLKKEGKIICSYCYKQYSVYELFELDWTVLRAMKKGCNQNEVQLQLSPSGEEMREEQLLQENNG